MIARTFLAAVALCGGFLVAQEHGDKAHADKKPTHEQKAEHRAALYPLDTCVVSGEKLEKDVVTFEVDGTTFKTCCEKCKAKVEKAPAEFAKKLEEASKQAQLAHYPLAICPISGKKLGGMGEPVQLMLEGTLVQLCCKSCVKKAKAAPKEMAAKVLAAAYGQQKQSANETCPVSGEKLGDDKVEVMYGTRLVRLCCEKCAAKFEGEPAKYEGNLKQHAPAAEPKKDEKKSDHDHGEKPKKDKG